MIGGAIRALLATVLIPSIFALQRVTIKKLFQKRIRAYWNWYTSTSTCELEAGIKSVSAISVDMKMIFRL